MNGCWEVGRMDDDTYGMGDYVFDDESLTWDAVGKVARANEPIYRTRSNVKGKTPKSSDYSGFRR